MQNKKNEHKTVVIIFATSLWQMCFSFLRSTNIRWTLNEQSIEIEKDGKFAERLLVYFLYFLGFLVKSDTFLLRYHACSNGLKILTTDTTLLVPWDLWQATKGQTAEYSHWKDEANLKQTQPNLPKNLICIRTVIV